MRALRWRQLAVVGVLAVSTAGCGLAGLAGGTAAGGSLAAEQHRQTVQVGETAAAQARAVSGQGYERIPALAGCPDDVTSLQRVVASVVRRSELAPAEQLAFDTLLRSAQACDPQLTGVPGLGTFQAN